MPAGFYEVLGGVVPFKAEAKRDPNYFTREYAEPKVEANGEFVLDLDNMFITGPITPYEDPYVTYFIYANLQYEYERLSELTGFRLNTPVELVISAIPRQSGGGLATHRKLHININTQYGGFNPNVFSSIVVHELFHVLHLQSGMSSGIIYTTPQWFLEGIAVYFAEPSDIYLSGEHTYQRYFSLAFMEYEHSNTHLHSAYGVAGEFVNYLAGKYGEEKLIELAFHPQNSDFNTEFKRIYGMSPSTAYTIWYLWGMHTGL